MNKIISSIYNLILLASMIIILSGCTIALGALGIQRDNRKPSDTYTVSKYELAMIKQGNRVEVHTIDGRIFKGTFLGTGTDNSFSIIRLRESVNNNLGIRCEGIKYIKVLAQKKNDWWMGLAVGAVLDGLLIWLNENSATVRLF